MVDVWKSHPQIIHSFWIRFKKKFNMKFLVLAFLAFMATQALAQGEVFGKTETEMEDMVIVEGR